MTRFVIVFRDDDSTMDSGCRNSILSEIKTHHGIIEQFFATQRDVPVEPIGNDYDGREEIKYAEPIPRRLC